jgi:hypothetical protein
LDAFEKNVDARVEEKMVSGPLRKRRYLNTEANRIEDTGNRRQEGDTRSTLAVYVNECQAHRTGLRCEKLCFRCLHGTHPRKTIDITMAAAKIESIKADQQLLLEAIWKLLRFEEVKYEGSTSQWPCLQFDNNRQLLKVLRHKCFLTPEMDLTIMTEMIRSRKHTDPVSFLLGSDTPDGARSKNPEKPKEDPDNLSESTMDFIDFCAANPQFSTALDQVQELGAFVRL